MLPIVTPAEMAAIDARATESVETLIDRAARAVAREAIDLLGGSYGRRVTVLAGPGNNGADGRMAAKHLARRGVRVEVISATAAPSSIPKVDLVIDAAFGTGLKRPYHPPTLAVGQRILAVDIPSGVDGLTGQRLGSPLGASRTVTFAALKGGHVLEPGRHLSGEIRLVDIGLDVSATQTFAVEDSDISPLLPQRPCDTHKWCAALGIVGGSMGMNGAVTLAAEAALRCGAGIVILAIPGASGYEVPTEAIVKPLLQDNWAEQACRVLDERMRAVLVGPGLGSHDPKGVLSMLNVSAPLVIDGDALTADLTLELHKRRAATILTPHDGEWQRLGGSTSNDRISATQTFAKKHHLIVVRKGPSTIIAEPAGRVRVIASATSSLATAGSGDVLAGMIVALLAQGLPPFAAATVGAHIHAMAGRKLGPNLIASDLPDAVGAIIRNTLTSGGQQ